METSLALKTIRVLVADDSAQVRRRLIVLLKGAANIEVVGQAADGRETLDQVQALRPDVIILDIQMPKITGLEVLRTLTQESSSPKIIMLTNYPYPQYRQKCIAAGASYFFDKSAEFDKIPQAIQHLSLNQTRTANYQGNTFSTKE